jgi:hypothetical protein
MNIKPSWFVKLTRIYKSWCNVVLCEKCGLKAKYEDCHPVEPCPNCGNRLTERVGRWKNKGWEILDP